MSTKLQILYRRMYDAEKQLLAHPAEKDALAHAKAYGAFYALYDLAAALNVINGYRTWLELENLTVE